MKNMRKVGMLGTMVAVALGTLTMGCGVEPQSDEGAAADATAVAPSTLLASVKLSPTHEIAFRDFGDGLGLVSETRHADLDRDAPLTMRNIDLGQHTLSDVYKMFAGQYVEAGALERLGAMDARVAARNLRDAQTPEPAPVATPKIASTKTLPNTRVTDEGMPLAAGGDIQVQRGANIFNNACTEPAWDWNGDDGWFFTNFCGSNSVRCAVQKIPSDNYGYDNNLRTYSSTGFAQSQCAGATYKLMARVHAGGISGGIYETALVNMTLSPRFLNTTSWTSNATTDYKSTITSLRNNFVALAIHRS
jgi:hypothetical protein